MHMMAMAIESAISQRERMIAERMIMGESNNDKMNPTMSAGPTFPRNQEAYVVEGFISSFKCKMPGCLTPSNSVSAQELRSIWCVVGSERAVR